MKRLKIFLLCLLVAGALAGGTISAVTQTDIIGLVIDSTGKVGIGTTAPGAGLEIYKGSSDDVALQLNSSGYGWGSGVVFKNTATGGRTYGIQSGNNGYLKFVDRTASIDRLFIDQYGNFYVLSGNLYVSVGNAFVAGTLTVKNVPNADKGNAQWDTASGQFYYDNSSARDKRNIKPLEDDFLKLLKAAPKTYTRPHSPGVWEIGYLAEDFESLGLSRLVRYDEAGRPDSINYTKMSLYMIEIQKRHDEELKRFAQKTDALEAEVRRLRAVVDELAAGRRPK